MSSERSGESESEAGESEAAGAEPRQLRVVVAGNSASVFVTPARTVRTDGTYGELLPGLLASEGVAADVRHVGRWFDRIDHLRSRYETDVRNHFPDVLILNFSSAEYQPSVVPSWLFRHIQTWNVSSNLIAHTYRRTVVPTLWRVLRRYQQLVAPRVGMHFFRLSPRRFRLEMERVILLAREQTRCLVLVLDGDPPGGRVCHWIPGMDKRWEPYQQVLADLVADLDDPEVRLVAASTRLIDEIGLEAGLPDGLHRSATAHVLTAELLAEEITQWLAAPIRIVESAASFAARPLHKR